MNHPCQLGSQSQIHDIDKALLATLEAVKLGSLPFDTGKCHRETCSQTYQTSHQKISLFVQRAAVAANLIAVKKGEGEP